MGAGEGAKVMTAKEKRAEYYKKWREENKEHVKRYDEANKEKKAKREIVKAYKKWNGFAPPAEYVEVKYIINKTNNLLKQNSL